MKMNRIILAILFVAMFVGNSKAQWFGSPTGVIPDINGWAVVTCFSGYTSPGSRTVKDDYVFGLINLHNPQGPNTNWQAQMYHHPSWKSSNIGQVFGIATDKRKNIYLTATTSYASNTSLLQTLKALNSGNIVIDDAYYDYLLQQSLQTQPNIFGTGSISPSWTVTTPLNANYTASYGAVYKVDATTGAVAPIIWTTSGATGNPPSAFIGSKLIPNGYGYSKISMLGNITYDPVHDKLFVTNMEDGTIYRIDPILEIIDKVYDPVAPQHPLGTSNPPMTIDPYGTAGFAAVGERIWGIGYNSRDNRLYYGVWMESVGNGTPNTSNIIRSIGLDVSGDFNPSSDDRAEIRMPKFPSADIVGSSASFSCPVSDIEFSSTGDMLVSESPMYGLVRTAHYARVFKFTGVSPTWSAPQQIFVGLPNSIPSNPYTNTNTQGTATAWYFPIAINGTFHANSSGGSDFGYWGSDLLGHPTYCDSSLVMNGDFLAQPSNFGIMYGLQQTPSIGNQRIPNTVQSTGYFVDFNGIPGVNDKFVVGDIDVFRDSCGSIAPTSNCALKQTRDSSISVSSGGTCCSQIRLSTSQLNTWLNVTANALTTGMTISVQSQNGWTVSNNTSISATLNPPGAYILPNATHTFILCGTSNLGVTPQKVEIVWHAVNGSQCRDTITMNCAVTPPPAPHCAIIKDTIIKCSLLNSSGTSYQYCFTLKNNNPFNAPASYLMVSSATAGVTVTPGSFTFPPLAFGATVGPLCVTLSGPGVVPGRTICLVYQLHQALGANGEVDGFCCTKDTFCIVLPPCTDCCKDFQKSFGTTGPITQPILGVSQLTTQLNAGPSAITKFTATIVSADRKINGDSKHCQTSGWLPVAGEIINPQASVGGLPLTTTPQPFVSAPPAPYSEAIWGIAPSGVVMTNTPFTLQMKFPDPPTLQWFAGHQTGLCTDSLRFCVRFTYTDVNCRTCDTLICYQVYRTGPWNDIVIGPGGGIGNVFVITMASKTAGTLTVDIPTLPSDLTSEVGRRMTSVSMESGAGVRLTQFDGKTAPGFVGTKSLALDNGQKTTIALTYDNYADQKKFTNFLKYRYVENRNTADTLTAYAEVVATVPGGASSGDIFAKDDSSAKPTNVRTYALYFANRNTANVPARTATLSVNEGTRILATGPLEDSVSVSYDIMNGVNDGKPHLFAISSRWASDAPECIPPRGSVVRPIYLTVAGELGKTLVVHYNTKDENGNLLSNDSVTLSDPLSIVHKSDPSAMRSSSYLYPPYPNPSSGSATIQFHLDASERVTITVMNLLGNEVARIVDNDYFVNGEHVFTFNPANLSSGEYIVRMQTSTGAQSQTLQIVR